MAKYVRSTNVKFVNPYNFISVGQENNRRTEESDQKHLTGKLSCKLYVKTPLAILDTNKKRVDENNNHPSYPFLTINGNPVIPGSSIRGMLRSYYETLTDSCFVTLSENESLTARTPANQPFQPGVLLRKDGTWVLYKATRGRLKVRGSDCSVALFNKERVIKKGDVIYHNGDYVDAEFQKVKETNRKGKEVSVCYGTLLGKSEKESEYVLFVGEPIFKKNYESIFQIKEQEIIGQDLLMNAINGLKNTVDFYQDSAINRKLGKKVNDHSGYANFKAAEQKGVIPLWYRKEGEHLYFSMACIGRMAFNNTLSDLIGEYRTRTPCVERDHLCPACRLFGTAKGDAFGSKIRVTDARGDTVALTENKIDLKELGSPRVGYFPFYSKDGKMYDEAGASILGRKYYWHIPEAAEKPDIYTKEDTSKNTERNSSCQLAEPGSEFSFDVYYDGITEEQLQELIWTISLGDNRKESPYCQKIGHGKPIGLGSVKLVVESDTRRTFDGEAYRMDSSIDGFKEQDMPARILNSVWEQMRRISDFEFMKGMDVRYPYISDEDNLVNGKPLKENVMANHVWFSENKAERKGGPKPLLLNPLDFKSKDDYALPIYKLSEIENTEYKNHSDRSHQDRSEIKGKGKKNGDKNSFIFGNVYSFTVIDYKENKKGKKQYLLLKDDCGRTASIPYDKVKQGEDATCVEKGTAVKLKYWGSDDKGYPKWKVCK